VWYTQLPTSLSIQTGSAAASLRAAHLARATPLYYYRKTLLMLLFLLLLLLSPMKKKEKQTLILERGVE
jgi:hypothetical protein